MILLFLCAALTLPGCGGTNTDFRSDTAMVFVARVEGKIDGRAADYVERVVSEAGEAGARAVVIELDTPGGRLDHTQRIIEVQSSAGSLPVIAYVTPGGARAASAGTFIVMGSDVAAMAPQTRLGAASPVDAFGRDIPGTMGEKVTNDAVALITGLANAHDRNEEWAESAVREAESLDADEALDIDVIEYVEPNLEAVLDAADGRRVEPKGITLDTARATLVQRSPNFKERFGISPYIIAIPAILAVLAAVSLVS